MCNSGEKKYEKYDKYFNIIYFKSHHQVLVKSSVDDGASVNRDSSYYSEEPGPRPKLCDSLSTNQIARFGREQCYRIFNSNDAFD